MSPASTGRTGNPDLFPRRRGLERGPLKITEARLDREASLIDEGSCLVRLEPGQTQPSVSTLFQYPRVIELVFPGHDGDRLRWLVDQRRDPQQPVGPKWRLIGCPAAAPHACGS